MPLSCFRRPLVIALALAIVLLCALERLGFFRVEPPDAMRSYLYDPGVVVEGRLLSGFSPKRAGDRFWVEADKTQGLRHRKARLMVYVSRKEDDRSLAPGQRVSLRGKLRLPLWPRNPGGFDEGAFLQERGAAVVMHAASVETLEARVPWRFKPWAWGDRVHRSVHDYLYGRFPKERASILEGLMLGYKGPLPSATNSAVQDAGAVHLIAPSGAKVAHVVLWALALCSLLRLPRPARAAAAALAGGGYVLAVGPEPPYTRAYFMGLALWACCLSGRESGSFQALALAASLTLMFDPRSLFGAGFQMSYLAMLGVLTALPRWEPPHGWPRTLRRGLQVLALSFVVQLMLWPVFARMFGRASLVGLLANVLLVPYSGFAMLAGFCAWAGELLPVPALEAAAAPLAGGMAGAFTWLCARFSGLPWAAVDLRDFGPGWTLAYYLFCGGLLVLPERRASARFLAASALLSSAIWLPSLLRRPEVRVVFLSLPNEEAALITLPDGRSVMAGGGKVQPAVLRAALRTLGIRRWEAVPSCLDWDGGGLARSAGGTALRLRHRDFQLDWEDGYAEARAGGPERYCIMTSSSRSPRGRCPSDRSRTTRRDGAVWVVSDGEKLEIRDQRRLYPHGRPVP